MTAELAGIDRDTAKTVNFGTLYGMGKGSLAALLGITEYQAKMIIERVRMLAPSTVIPTGRAW